MDHLALLTYSEELLGQVVGEIAADEMDLGTNCPPWTTRQLASHALKNQLFWAGTVVDEDLMALDEAMAAVPYEGNLGPIASEVTRLAVQLWHRDGIMTAEHTTPFGVLPGAVVVNFAIVDAAAHAWDISASLGRPIDFSRDAVAALTDVFVLTCTEHTVELGLVKPPTVPRDSATDTERLLASAGRTIAP